MARVRPSPRRTAAPRHRIAASVRRRWRIAVVHGPNLDLLGAREPAVYGHETLRDIDQALLALGQKLGARVKSFQSNHEGALVEHLHGLRGRADAIVINAAGLTHTSVVLRDALAAVALPFVEVHLSNVFAREPFRHVSLLAGIAVGLVSGFGALSYELGLRALVARLEQSSVR